ncbi:hypothetical protein, partial [Neisseria bergeri]|uniref:hypothetical protein n=1 Tax=Neisseria bergeri TaxID=1906581 RepID=UPI00272CB307
MLQALAVTRSKRRLPGCSIGTGCAKKCPIGGHFIYRTPPKGRNTFFNSEKKKKIEKSGCLF